MANLEGGNLNKFLIVKTDDINNYLEEKEKNTLKDIVYEVNMLRHIHGKKENTYLVINTDEPYADEIIEILKKNGHWG